MAQPLQQTPAISGIQSMKLFIRNNVNMFFFRSFPSSFTPTSTGSCEIKVSKCSEDICQLRLDFQTMSGFTAAVGICTDKFTAEGIDIFLVYTSKHNCSGQTGVNPPSICGTNTGYHSNHIVIIFTFLILQS